MRPVWTKRQVIQDAFTELGLGSYAYDARPEDLQDALRRLNALLAEWSAQGALTGFSGNNTPGSDDLDNTSNLPPDAVRGAICALAVDIAPGYGKTPSPSTMAAANQGRNLMMRKAAIIPEKLMDNRMVPAGAGHKRERNILLHNGQHGITKDQRNG